MKRIPIIHTVLYVFTAITLLIGIIFSIDCFMYIGYLTLLFASILTIIHAIKGPPKNK